MSYEILVVDDDLQALESTRKILELAGFRVTTASDGQSALDQVRPTPNQAGGFDSKPGRHFDLVLTDVRMPRLGGLEFLRALSLCGETMPVILMTAFGRVEDAVWAMKLGAVDFLTKPFKRQVLLSSIEAALKRSRARAQAAAVQNTVGGTGSATSGSEKDLLIGRSAALEELRVLIRRVSSTHANVLLTGESGTGKELVARCLHQQSPRAQERLIALNCAAMPEQLIESELFGFEKGAFSGATSSKEGLFEAAHKGTLLLDEIGDMPFPVQAKLLRVLQEGEVRRLGSTVSKKIDVRVIAATHKDLKQCVQEGTFRQDLLYRLEVVGIHVPPLRERAEDIIDLAYHFLRIAAKRHGKETPGHQDSPGAADSQIILSEDTLDVLKAYSWPGNVRELSNVIERAVVFLTSNHITRAELPPHLFASEGLSKVQGPSAGSTIAVPLGASLKDVEELLIRKTLEATAGDKNMTAKLLGINSRTIYRKLDKRLEKDPE